MIDRPGCSCCDFGTVPTSELVKGLADIDYILKATKILPEWKAMIALENRLRKIAAAEWKKRASRAVSSAVARARRSRGEVKDSDVEAILRAIEAEFDGFGKTLRPHIQTVTDEAYKLAISAMNKKVQGKFRGSLRYDFVPVKKAPPIDPELEASFSVVDDDAVESLTRRHSIWIGEHYTRSLSGSVRDFVKEAVVTRGRDPEDVATELQRILRKEFAYDPADPFEGPYLRIPSGWRGSADEYFEGLAANVSTVARVSGQLSALRRVGATKYVIVNPMDERTCPECSYMAGQSVESGGMSVADAWGAQRREIGATPEAIRERLHPWLKLDAMKTRAGVFGKWGKSGASKFIKGGMGFPPYHTRCRCTVDIADDAEFV